MESDDCARESGRGGIESSAISTGLGDSSKIGSSFKEVLECSDFTLELTCRLSSSLKPLPFRFTPLCKPLSSIVQSIGFSEPISSASTTFMPMPMPASSSSSTLLVDPLSDEAFASSHSSPSSSSSNTSAIVELDPRRCRPNRGFSNSGADSALLW